MKKNLIKIITIAIMAAFLFPSAALAKGKNDIYVRVRIRYPRLFNEQVSFEGYDEILIYDDYDELFSLNNKLNLRIDTYYTGNYYLSDKSQGIYGPYHAVLFDETYSSYEKALRKAQELEEEFNFDFYPYLTKEGFIIAGGNFTDKNSSQKLADKLNNNGCNAESYSGNLENILAYNNKNQPLFMYEKNIPLYFSSYSYDEGYEMIKVDNRAYRGRISLNIIEDYRMITINEVELENYLYGVVPNEIPSSWGMESLKAQALAARTYAVYNISPNQAYDMEDNQNSQVYMGYDYEKSSTSRAVDETAGEMIYYENYFVDKDGRQHKKN